MSTIRLEAGQLDAFAALSHDRSPLHVDPTYARRTPFGRPLVHGVAGVLLALGAWAGGRRLSLSRIAARFHRPLFLDDDYQLEVEEGPSLRLELTRAGETHLALDATSGPHPVWTPSFPPFVPRPTARDDASPRRIERFDYAPRLEPALLAALGLTVDQLPASQLAALAWCSYVVGMEHPGREALFVALDLRFAPPAPEPFHLRDVQLLLDDRFGRAEITATGTGVEQLRLTAQRRPPPVELDAEELRTRMGASRAFAGKDVLVTGSSRGFGAALARGFALAGARVVLSARQESPELARVVDETGGAAVVGDVAEPSVCERLPATDLLVLSAIPTIPVTDLVRAPIETTQRFIVDVVALALAPLHALLPRLAAGSVVVLISSQYVREPQPRLAAYVAAKSAVEGLLRTVALEHPELRFVIARPPRMLTDQTNALVRSGPMAGTGAMAAALLERLATLPEAPGLVELDL